MNRLHWRLFLPLLLFKIWGCFATYMVRRILDFAHFKLRNRRDQQSERGLSVEVK